jgi:hypothetical protein
VGSYPSFSFQGCHLVEVHIVSSPTRATARLWPPGQTQPPASSGGKPRQDLGVEDEAREAALMQEILRRQEQHREGGVEPELDETSEDPRPKA